MMIPEPLFPLDPGILSYPPNSPPVPAPTSLVPAPVATSPVQASTSSISLMASVLSQLDQLQQKSPADYANVASSMATQLHADAKTAQSDGNASAAKTLTKLATLFQDSAKASQVPSPQNIQTALSEHRHQDGQDPELDKRGPGAQATSLSTFSPTARETLSQPSVESLLGAAFTSAMNSINS